VHPPRLVTAAIGGTAPGAWLTAALDLVFPARCPVCSQPLGDGRRDPLCGGCWNAIERIAAPWCTTCGLPFGTLEPPAGPEALVARCGPCARQAPPFAWARAAGRYAGPLRDAIHALKFHGRRALARPLADLVLDQAGDAWSAGVAALVPVPLQAARERERGFNQANLIAERIGAATGVRVRGGWLSRTRATRPQADLTASERAVNVRRAFAASPAVNGLDVVVVDDVLTTGATVRDCARALAAAGARQVGVLAVARVI
jgi:ComF family protein